MVGREQKDREIKKRERHHLYKYKNIDEARERNRERDRLYKWLEQKDR